MTQKKKSLWTRIAHFFAPPRETYDSRRDRPGEAGAGPQNAIYEATDRRRHGGSMEIGN